MGLDVVPRSLALFAIPVVIDIPIKRLVAVLEVGNVVRYIVFVFMTALDTFIHPNSSMTNGGRTPALR